MKGWIKQLEVNKTPLKTTPLEDYLISRYSMASPQRQIYKSLIRNMSKNKPHLWIEPMKISGGKVITSTNVT